MNTKPIVLYFGFIPKDLQGEELMEAIKKAIEDCDYVEIPAGQYVAPELFTPG